MSAAPIHGTRRIPLGSDHGFAHRSEQELEIVPRARPHEKGMERNVTRDEFNRYIVDNQERWPLPFWICAQLQNRGGVETACRSRIRHQAAAGSWTMPRQWEIQRTWLNSARAAVRSPAKPNGV